MIGKSFLFISSINTFAKDLFFIEAFVEQVNLQNFYKQVCNNWSMQFYFEHYDSNKSLLLALCLTFHGITEIHLLEKKR